MQRTPLNQERDMFAETPGGELATLSETEVPPSPTEVFVLFFCLIAKTFQFISIIVSPQLILGV